VGYLFCRRYWVGGNVTFDNGQWSVTNNRAELGGLAGTGGVGLVGSGNQMQLAFPEGLKILTAA
jgi:hypothetical protein